MKSEEGSLGWATTEKAPEWEFRWGYCWGWGELIEDLKYLLSLTRNLFK